jgi:hypothetical protein
MHHALGASSPMGMLRYLGAQTIQIKRQEPI